MGFLSVRGENIIKNLTKNQSCRCEPSQSILECSDNDPWTNSTDYDHPQSSTFSNYFTTNQYMITKEKLDKTENDYVNINF